MRTTDNTMLGFEGHSRFNFELIFFLLALGFNLFVVIVWLRNPLVDYYSFRQAQTAMSAYWMKQDGQWFNLLKYETPEFGAPWRIPYEFPIYQWIVAVLYQITHISLDTLGRATSAVFFYGCFPLLYMIIRGLRMDRRLFFLAAGMLLLSPIYMYWSRTFMMESTVLFFCFFYVAALQKYLSTDRPVLWWILMTLAGIAALLVKVTTFPAFAFAAFALVLSDMATSQNFKSRARWLRTYLPIGLGMVLMLAIIKLWLNYSDMVKESNDFTRHLTSAALDTWNWGTLQQRFSSALWITTIFNRTIPQAIGSTGALVIVLIAFFWRDRNHEK